MLIGNDMKSIRPTLKARAITNHNYTVMTIRILGLSALVILSGATVFLWMIALTPTV